MLVERFEEVWEKLGATKPWKPAYKNILAAYLQPHRVYHNLEQVSDFLEELDGYTEKNRLLHMEEAQAVGIWKDIGPDKSLSSMACFWDLSTGKVASAKILRITAGIIGAMHATSQIVEQDMWPAMDADLAILGKTRVRYDRYRKDLEHELRYTGFPEIAYVKYRLKILQLLLDRQPYIYRTEYFGNKYDVRARANMEYEKVILQNRLSRL